MSAGLKRTQKTGRILLAAAAAITTAGMFAGCDNAQNEADKRVISQLQDARRSASTGNPTDFEYARKQLDLAAGDGSVSDGLRAEARAAVGRAEMRTAESYIRQIERLELESARLVSEIAALTEQIRGTSTTVSGYRQFDPKPTLDAIAEKIATAEGGADKPAWISNGTVSIPSLAAVKQELARLDGQVSQKQSEVAALTGQRTTLLDQAEKAIADAEQLKGSQSVEAFKKGSELRKQAGDLAVQIEKAQADTTRLKAAIATAQLQQSAATDTITQLKDQSATLQKSWTDMDGRAAAQRKLAGEILGSSGTAFPGAGDAPKATAGGNIAQKAIELARLTTESRKLRESAQASLTNAAKSFAEADRAAGSAVKALKDLSVNHPTHPQKAAWDQMQKVIDPMQYRLEQAGAQRAIGALANSDAAGIASRISLANSLQQALGGTELSVPTGIVDTSSSEAYKSALGMADLAFKEADALLEGINEGLALESIKNDALIGRALTNYGWAQVARQLNDKASADKRIALAKEFRDLVAEKLADKQGALPAMPAELGAAKKKVVAPVEDPAAALNPADSPDQAAVRAAYKQFMDSMSAGDAAATKALMQIDPGQEKAAEQIIQTGAVMKKLQDAFIAKFGAEGTTTTSPDGSGTVTTSFNLATSSSDIGKAVITVTGETGTIKAARGPGSDNPVTRVDGAWKMHITAPKTDQEKAEYEAMPKMNVAAAKIATEIEAGKYATPADAIGAIMGALMESMGATPTVAPGANAAGGTTAPTPPAQ